jgi:hypothetical protein
MTRDPARSSRYGPRGSVPSGCVVQATFLFVFLLMFYLAALVITNHGESGSRHITLPAIENNQPLSGGPDSAPRPFWTRIESGSANA